MTGGRGTDLETRSSDTSRTKSEGSQSRTSLEEPTLHRIVDAATKKQLIPLSGRSPYSD